MAEELTVQIFNQNWDLYKKVVEADYLHHNFMQELTNKEVLEKGNNQSIRFLDLGCGDAYQILTLLKKINIIEYAGYDLSENALALAEENLAFLAGKSRLIQGQMELMLPAEQQNFDIVHTSYAVHHLSDAQKAILLQNISEKMTPEAIFIYIDVFISNEIDRATYIKKYCDTIDQEWTILNNEEKENVKYHISSYDYPASFDFITKTAAQYGLTLMNSETNDQAHYFLCFKKN